MSERKKELIIEFEYLEKQIQTTTEKLDALDKQAIQLKSSIDAITILSAKSEHESLVPIANGVYVEATVKNTKKFVVDVGSDVAVPKTSEEALDIFEVQLAATHEYQEKIIQRLESLSKRADQLQHELMKISRGEA